MIFAVFDVSVIACRRIYGV